LSQYVPKPDLEGINTTEKHEPLKDFIILLAGFMMFLVIAYATLGAAGEWLFTRISIEQELKIIGPIWKKRNLATQTPNELLLINQKLNIRLGYPLQIEIKCDKSPNAYALPGGRILLTKGLFENIKSENGLMFVIGHEIGHVMNRDHMRGFGRSLIFALFNSMIGISADTDSGLEMMNNVFARSYNRKVPKNFLNLCNPKKHTLKNL
jgi:Zn-dependent protease with chaperone function